MYLLQNILEVLFKDVIFYKLVTNRLFIRLRTQKGIPMINQPMKRNVQKVFRRYENVNKQQDT